MPPQPLRVPAPAVGLYEGYLDWLAARGVGNPSFYSAARGWLVRFPDPQAWAGLPLAERLRVTNAQGPLLGFLMLHGHLQPGYDYLLERRLHAVLRDAARSPIGPAVEVFVAAAERFGYSVSARRGMASQIAARLLIQTATTAWSGIVDADYAAFQAALEDREARSGEQLKHYWSALHASRAVIYHLGAPAEPAPKRSTLARWSWDRHLEGVRPAVLAPMVAYLQRLEGTHARSSVQSSASDLAHFGRFLARTDPELRSLADLDRRRHIEAYLNELSGAVNHRTGAPLAASTRKERTLSLGLFFDAMAEWGWPDAPARKLVFHSDAPKIPHPLPRYLPVDTDRRLIEALRDSPNRLRADALLLLRTTGLRIGELVNLELDCVHEILGEGAWLKVPLGKLLTERMVPIDDDTVWIIDRIVEHRCPGRPLRDRSTGRLVEFLFTHQGRRLSADTIRAELHRAAGQAGLHPAPTPHQLRHTFATAMVNSGCSLQALMAMLGHVSAEMSLRYGRLFDKTVRDEYERALAQAKASIRPPLPEATPVQLNTDWRTTPLIKARLAGGYCVRTLAQGVCPYTNICEHCPSFRTEATFLPALAAQRADTEALLADAHQRGWGEEAERHRRLLERLDTLIGRADTA
jgi:site-specific recombinase XerD